MLVAAAVCPHPPLLVPAVAQGIAPDLDECRASCAAAIDALLTSEPDLLAVVGAGVHTRIHDDQASGTLAPYGVDLVLGPRVGVPELPLPLGIARWLLEARVLPPLLFQQVAASASPDECAAIGADISRVAPRVAVLVMGDGSAFPSQTPVGDDGRGSRYDDRVVAALTSGDADALLALDPFDDAPLWVAGRPAWQTLAGALRADGRRWVGEITWRGAPYGVGYVVAELVPS